MSGKISIAFEISYYFVVMYKRILYMWDGIER